MKKLFVLSALISIASASCKKAVELKFDAADNIYFDFKSGTSDRDSIIYTFAYEPGKASDTVFLPVRISGNRRPIDRVFKLDMVDGSTAVVGTHFEPLKEFYTIPADSGTYQLPIVLLNSDPALSERSVTLKVTLVGTSDFGLNITGLTTGKIVFSSKLEKPEWWEMWLGAYYSRVKHELFLISTGVTEMTMDGLDAPKNLFYVGLLTSFLNDPSGWVEKNPESGYTLELRPDGGYDFYNTGNSGKKMELRKNPDSGKFFFIDENGQEVI